MDFLLGSAMGRSVDVKFHFEIVEALAVGFFVPHQDALRPYQDVRVLFQFFDGLQARNEGFVHEI
jgi:hypothetical protein